MKVTSVELHPRNSSDAVVLSFRDASRTSPYNIKAIVGLGAEDIFPKYYGPSLSTKFYELSLMKRSIVLSIQLNPRYDQNETVSDLRDNLYKMISSYRTGKIQLQFINDTEVVAAISGFVSKFETAQFEKIQEVQITINCDEPMLKAPNLVTVGVTGLNPADTTIDDKKSNAPHGFVFDMTITATIASITINDPNDLSWSFQIVPTSNFLNGDVLHFSNIYNNKYLYFTRGAVTTYLADKIAAGSVWPMIFPGNNRFKFTNPTSLVWKSISYYPTYWGV